MSESGAAGEKGFQRTRRTESAVEYVYDTDIRLRLYERAQARHLSLKLGVANRGLGIMFRVERALNRRHQSQEAAAD